MKATIALLLRQVCSSAEQYGRACMKDWDLSPAQGFVLDHLLAQQGEACATELHRQFWHFQVHLVRAAEQPAEKGLCGDGPRPRRRAKKAAGAHPQGAKGGAPPARRLGKAGGRPLPGHPPQGAGAAAGHPLPDAGESQPSKLRRNDYDKNTAAAGEGVQGRLPARAACSPGWRCLWRCSSPL